MAAAKQRSFALPWRYLQYTRRKEKTEHFRENSELDQSHPVGPRSREQLSLSPPDPWSSFLTDTIQHPSFGVKIEKGNRKEDSVIFVPFDPSLHFSMIWTEGVMLCPLDPSEVAVKSSWQEVRLYVKPAQKWLALKSQCFGLLPYSPQKSYPLWNLSFLFLFFFLPSFLLFFYWHIIDK